ncbi:MAG: RidA family protein [Pseudomonadota bacterium]
MSINRYQTGERMSQAVAHGNTLYTAGQVAKGAPGESMTAQTRDVLNSIDALLADAGTDKSKLLSAMIWITNMEDFAEMNAVWDAWVSAGNTPCRACVQSGLASDDFCVEIQVIAALD